MHADHFSTYLALEGQQMAAHLHAPQERQVLSGQAVQITERWVRWQDQRVVLSLCIGIMNEEAVLHQKHLRVPAAMPAQRVGYQGQHNVCIGSLQIAGK